jgi:leucyl-tRNA synthetase
VNGKVRAKLVVAPGTDALALEAAALNDPNVTRHTEGKKIVKKIIIPDKLVNLVVAG